MAYQLTVLYKQPDDTAAFDRYYESTHAPLALKLGGLRGYTISRPAPGPDGTPPPYHLVAILTWDSAEDLQAAMGSPEGQAAQQDLANFATGGAEILVGPVDSAM